MNYSNIDDVTASAYDKTADFANVDSRASMIDTAVQKKMTDIMYDPSIPIDAKNQARESENFNRIFTQKEKNSFREFDQRQSAAADVGMIETELLWQRESVDEVKSIMDNGGVLQDVTSSFEAKGYTPARVKAITDMAAKYIPKGEVFDESKMTPDEKYKRLTHEIAVQEGFSVVAGNISKLRSMDFDTRDKDKIKERNAIIGTIRDSLTAHFMLLEQSKDFISRNRYIKEVFKNISAQSDLFDIVSTAKKDTIGGKISKSNDNRNAVKLLGLRADAIETGIMSEGYSAPERQAMANRLRMEGIRAYSEGEQFIMNSEEDATAFVKAFEKETVNEISKNPDAYDLMMASKADTQWQPPSDQDMIDQIADHIELGNNPRRDTINELTGWGLTPERAEQVYQQYAPRAFEKVMIKQNRTPEQVGLDTLHDDLKDFVKRVPDADVVTLSTQDATSGSINRDMMDAGSIRSNYSFIDIATKVLSSAGETDSINFPKGIRISSGTEVQAGMTIGGLDLAHGGEQIDRVLKLANLSKDEIDTVNKYRGIKSQDLSTGEHKKILKEAERDLTPLLPRIRKALIASNESDLFNRVGKPGNYDSVEDIPYLKELTPRQRGALVGMRVKSNLIDYIVPDKGVKTKSDLVKAIKDRIKRNDVEDIDRSMYKIYLKEFE